MSLKIIHDLSKLSPEEEIQYLRDVSVFIGLDPDLGGLDTIWMPNENGPGQSKVVYARRGTAEILREVHGIEVSTLTNEITSESAVFTATGKNKTKRQEIAIGSKSLRGLNGRAYDNAIMTASTRALRRLTMQFTKLGILDESEIEGMKTETATVGPASNAQLSGSPVVMPPMPVVQPNNAPGKVTLGSVGIPTPAGEVVIPEAVKLAPSLTLATVINHEAGTIAHEKPLDAQFLGQQTQVDAAWKQQADKKAAETPASAVPVAPANPVESPVATSPEPAKEADINPDIPARQKRTRKPKNSVNMGDVEPEVVQAPSSAPTASPAPVAIVPQVPAPPPQTMPVTEVGQTVLPSVPASQVVTTPAPAPAAAPSSDFEGKPTEAQMGEYRKKVSVYTAELPSSEGMGSVQKMRAFITRMSGTAPQFMTTDQWQEMIGWFEQFAGKNQMKGLVKYINDTLGVK